MEVVLTCIAALSGCAACVFVSRSSPSLFAEACGSACCDALDGAGPSCWVVVVLHSWFYNFRIAPAADQIWRGAGQVRVPAAAAGMRAGHMRALGTEKCDEKMQMAVPHPRHINCHFYGHV